MSENVWLVTGGAGFIGANFVRKARQEKWAVIVNLDKLTYAGNLDNLAEFTNDPGHIFVQGDICDRGLVRQLLVQHKPTAIIHFAAESHVDRSIDQPDVFIQTNVLGTHNLLHETRKYFVSLDKTAKSRLRFLHISTDEVFGSLTDTMRPFNEESRYAPNNPYAASKAGSDHLVRGFFRTFQLPTLTINCSNNYGPYQFPEKLIPLCLIKALRGEPIPVYGNGKNIRDWLYVEDHVAAIAQVLAKGRVGESYCVGGDSETRNLDVVKALCTSLDSLRPKADKHSYAELMTFVSDRPGHDYRYAIDSRKIKHETGWSPAVDFKTALNRTIQWYLDHGVWLERAVSGVYRGERLGLGGV